MTSGHLSYLALGDSYTIGHGINLSESFPMVLYKELNARQISIKAPEIIAKTGWTTGDLKKGIEKAQIAGKKYDLVSLLIGVNNYYDGGSIETYESEFRVLLRQSIDFAGENNKRVFVISIPDYGFTPFGIAKQVEISRGVDKFNEINKQITDLMGVHYFDIVSISRQGLIDPELVAEDGLHPSGKMYKQWVDYILKDIIKMLQ